MKNKLGLIAQILIIPLLFISCNKDVNEDIDNNTSIFLLKKDKNRKNLNTGIHISKILPLKGKLSPNYNKRMANEYGDYYLTGSVYDTTDCYYYPPERRILCTKDDVFLQKYDNTDILVWQKIWKNENPSNFVPSIDEGVFLATFTNKKNGYNILIRKINKEGKEIWKREIGNDEEPDRVNSLVSTKDGGVICTGKSESFGDKNYGDIITFKLDSRGEMVWLDTFEDNDQEIPNEIITTSDGGCIVVGNNFNKKYNSDNLIVLKYNSLGNRQWVKNFKLNNWTKGFSIIETDKGDYIISGHAYPKNDSKSYLLCLNNTGIKKWFKEIDMWSSILLKLNNNELLLAGYISKNAYFTRFNESGDELSRKTLHFPYWQNTMSIANKGNDILVFYNSKIDTNDSLFLSIEYQTVEIE